MDLVDCDCFVYQSGALFSRVFFRELCTGCFVDVSKMILRLVTIFAVVGELKCVILVSVVTW